MYRVQSTEDKIDSGDSPRPSFWAGQPCPSIDGCEGPEAPSEVEGRKSRGVPIHFFGLHSDLKYVTVSVAEQDRRSLLSGRGKSELHRVRCLSQGRGE